MSNHDSNEGAFREPHSLSLEDPAIESYMEQIGRPSYGYNELRTQLRAQRGSYRTPPRIIWGLVLSGISVVISMFALLLSLKLL